MKTLICQISLATILLTGCSKQEEQSAPSVAAEKPAAAPPAPIAETSKAVADTATQTKDEAQSAATEATKTADTVKNDVASAAAAPAGFQAWTDKVKGLISQQKYSEALAAFTELPANLTPEQQKLVEQLKAQVQQALSKQTTDQGLKAVGGLLNGTKK